MHIEIYSDLVCPWCYVGRQRLHAALAQRPDLPVDVRWLPFELNPGIGPQGMDRTEYLTGKFGDAAQLAAMQRHIGEVGSEFGIDFHFERIRKTPNTRAAHSLMAVAAAAGKQNEVVGAVFAAYFEQGRDLGDLDVLAEIGAAHGLARDATLAALADRRHHAQIVAHERQAAQWGISGVPTFIFDRRYAVSGAQEPAVFLKVFDSLRAAA